MHLLPEHKEKVIDLIRNGEEKEAIQYVQHQLGLDFKNSSLLVTSIRKDLQIKNRLHTVASLKRRQEKKSEFKLKLFFGTMALFGALLLSNAYYLDYRSEGFVKNGIKLQGVIKNDLLQYEHGGKRFIYAIKNTRDDNSYIEGDVVDIFINPLNTSEFKMNTYENLWSLRDTYITLGCLFFVPGFLLFYLMTRKVKPDNK